MLKRHPFLKTLLKIFAVIAVSISTFVMGFVVLFFILVAFIVGASSLSGNDPSLPKTYNYVYGSPDSDNLILVVPVTGLILGDVSDGQDPFGLLSGVTYGYEIKRALYSAVDDEKIKGIVLTINSPGGTIYGSKAIADGVAYYKKTTGKPVLTYIGGLAASGGYWAAISSDLVAADYGSTIGSIGVLSGPFKYYDTVTSEDGGAFVGGVVTQNGIETTYISAGKSKDVGNPYRPLTAEETTQLTQMVNNEYDTFLTYVSQRRKIPTTTLRNTVGAMVYDNKTAISHKLIDKTMVQEDVYEEAASRAGLENEDYKVVAQESPLTFVETLLSTQFQENQSGASICSAVRVFAFHGDVTSLCR